MEIKVSKRNQSKKATITINKWELIHLIKNLNDLNVSIAKETIIHFNDGNIIHIIIKEKTDSP